MNKVGVCYHPKLREELGRRVADELHAVAARHVEHAWIASAWDDDAAAREMPGTDLVVSVGGDGTVLRVARTVVGHGALLLGVNMGRLGFLTELDAAGAVERLPGVIAGDFRVEERAMLNAQIVREDGAGDETPTSHDALNDAVIGRTTLGRTIQVLIRVDGAPMAEFRADGVIVATATGSTAYSLSAGGPILPPESKEILLTPVAPHLAGHNPIVLPGAAVIDVALPPNQEVTLSIDGERELDLAHGETVRMQQGERVARFVRLGPPAQFYERLARRMNWLPSDPEAAAARVRELLAKEAPA